MKGSQCTSEYIETDLLSFCHLVLVDGDDKHKTFLPPQTVKGCGCRCPLAVQNGISRARRPAPSSFSSSEGGKEDGTCDSTLLAVSVLPAGSSVHADRGASECHDDEGLRHLWSWH